MSRMTGQRSSPEAVEMQYWPVTSSLNFSEWFLIISIKKHWHKDYLNMVYDTFYSPYQTPFGFSCIPEPGATVTCDEDNMTISLEKQTFPFFDANNLHLRYSSCR